MLVSFCLTTGTVPPDLPGSMVISRAGEMWTNWQLTMQPFCHAKQAQENITAGKAVATVIGVNNTFCKSASRKHAKN